MSQDTNQSNPTANQGKMIDFVPQKSNKDSIVDSPRPVTSAKDAINAMYANRAQQPQAKLVPSAREAVNAAASKTVVERQKSAANLHHGSIQKNMESTRTSASALLKVAKSEKPSLESAQPLNSFDPLAKPKPVTKPKRPRQVAYGSVPVVRTSLKLGSAARPKPTPVVLPPHARMAEGARPVGSSTRPKKLSNLLNRRLVDAEIVPKATPIATPPKPRQLVDNTTAVAVDVMEAKPTPTRRSSGPIRDPQMVRVPRRTTTEAAREAARTARIADIVSEQMGQPPRFTTAPKGYATKRPEAMPADNAYVMSEPPKLNTKKTTPTIKKSDNKLGVIENYHQTREPQPLGDKAPIGRVTEQKVASGHGGAASTEKVKADNKSDYSFSRHLEPDANRYALGGQSPFLKSVNVEKRPLSGSAPRKSSTTASTTVAAPSTASTKSRKNVYPKKETPATSAKQNLPSRPTVIVPSSHRSKAPLFFLVLLTIVLGAAVGAAAYLCFFQ